MDTPTAVNEGCVNAAAGEAAVFKLNNGESFNPVCFGECCALYAFIMWQNTTLVMGWDLKCDVYFNYPLN